MYMLMLIQSHTFTPSLIHLTNRFHQNPISSLRISSSSSSQSTESSARKSSSAWNWNGVRNKMLFHQSYSEMFSSSMTDKLNYSVSRLSGVMNLHLRRKTMVFSVSEGQNSSIDTERKRKVVEHICLLKAKEDLSDEEEKDMLDYLYTSQYQMGGIVAISLGRISARDLENYTHAVYMRFQRKEDLAKFYENPFYLGVLKDHVMPYCHVRPDMVYSMWITNLK